jgi:hypothetical protein
MHLSNIEPKQLKMIKVEVSSLTGAALDWAVAKCKGDNPDYALECNFRPSCNGEQGIQIIQTNRICIDPDSAPSKMWTARIWGLCNEYGPTPLIAAMRCFVVSKQGGEVEVPASLV